jgi:uncharacterized protein (TIGR02266 family)
VARTLRLKIKNRSKTADELAGRLGGDANREGIFLPTKKPLAPGTRLNFELLLQDGTPALAGSGQVRWRRPPETAGDLAPGMGVRFVELSPESRSLVDRAVSSYGGDACRYENTEGAEILEPESTTPDSPALPSGSEPPAGTPAVADESEPPPDDSAAASSPEAPPVDSTPAPVGDPGGETPIADPAAADAPGDDPGVVERKVDEFFEMVQTIPPPDSQSDEVDDVEASIALTSDGDHRIERASGFGFGAEAASADPAGGGARLSEEMLFSETETPEEPVGRESLKSEFTSETQYPAASTEPEGYARLRLKKPSLITVFRVCLVLLLAGACALGAFAWFKGFESFEEFYRYLFEFFPQLRSHIPE